MTRILTFGLAAVVLACGAQFGPAVVAHASAKADTASIRGSVTDPSGAVIAGAMVTISTPLFTRTVSTDEFGRFAVTGLLPGHYHVRIHFGGFAPFDHNNFVVIEGRDTEANAQLELREMRQTVTVYE